MAYSYYRSITIDHTKCGSSNSTNFPVLVSGTYSYLATVANGGLVQSSSGYDIQFYSDAGLTTALNFERVAWSASTGACIFYVKVPTLSSSSDTVIYMAYGDASVSTDQQSATSVWDSNFLSVWHLGDGSGIRTSDSTSNSISLTNSGTTATSGVSGLSNTAANFSGSSQYITGGTSSTLDLTSDFTFEVVANPTNFTGFNGLLSRANTNLPNPYDWYVVATSGVPRLFLGNGSSNTNYDGTTALTAGSWNYVSVSMNGTTCAHTVNTTTNSGTLSNSRSGANKTLYIGNRADSATMFTGKMFEIRISNSVRSADWKTATYNSIINYSTFYTVGSQVANGSFMPRQQTRNLVPLRRSYNW